MAKKQGKSALNKIMRKKPQDLMRRASAEIAEHGTAGFLKRATKTLLTGELPTEASQPVARISTLAELKDRFVPGAASQPVQRLDRNTQPVVSLLAQLDLPAMQQFLRRSRARVAKSQSLQALKDQLDQLVLLSQIPLDGLDGSGANAGPAIAEVPRNPLVVSEPQDPSILGLRQRWLTGAAAEQTLGPAAQLIRLWQHTREALEANRHDLVDIRVAGVTGLAALRAAGELGVPAVYRGPVSLIEGTDYWAVVDRKIQQILLQECASVGAADLDDAQRSIDLGVDKERIDVEGGVDSSELRKLQFQRQRATSILKGPTYRKNTEDVRLAEQYLLEQEVSIPPHEVATIALPPTFREDPFGDNNWRFSFHSLRWTDRLRRAFLATKDTKYKEAHLRVIKRWIRTYGDPSNKEALNQTWSDMGTGIRARGMAAALHTYGYDAEVVASLKVHLTWLGDESNWPARGNHLLHVYRGLYDTAAVLGHAGEEERALKLIYEYLRAEISEEGEDTEGSLMYQLANHQWSKEIVAELEADGQEVPEDITRRVRLMRNIGFYATDGGGNMAQYGDSNNVVRKPVVYGSKLPAPDGDHTHVRALQIYPKAGIACVRSKTTDPDKSVFAMLRVHPPGPKQTHGHDDHGQVLLSFGKHQVLRDSGRFDYSRDPRSVFLKSAAAHSVARSSDPRKWPEDYVRGHFGPVTEGDTFRAVRSVSQYAPDITWYRTLVVHDDGDVDVYDYWDAPDGETFDLLWQLDQFEFIKKTGKRIILRNLEGSDIEIVNANFMSNVNYLLGNMNPYLGYRSNFYQEMIPSYCLLHEKLPPRTLIITSMSII